MGVKNSLTSNGATSVLAVKISPEMNEQIQNLADRETKCNKSEMIRILITEALEERMKTETMICEMAENETRKME